MDAKPFLALVVLAPYLVNSIIVRFIRSSRAAILTLTVSSVLSLGSAGLLLTAFKNPFCILDIPLMRWISLPQTESFLAIHMDLLSLALATLVSGLTLPTYIFSYWYFLSDYRTHEKEFAFSRFLSHISFFVFCMLLFVMSDNFLQSLFAWEGMGFTSFILVGFYFQREQVQKCALRIFLINKVSDIALIAAIILIFHLFGTLQFSAISKTLASYSSGSSEIANGVVGDFRLSYNHSVALICSLVLLSSVVKSAQIGFHTWLSDAMVGPTPVSALLHSATMVVSGVILIAKCAPLFERSSVILGYMAVIGASSAILGGYLAWRTHNIKRLMAYSTFSQIGIMFLALGASAYGFALVYLVVHACFKMLMFLCVGMLTKLNDHQQNILSLHRVKSKIAYVAMLISGATMLGIFPTAGFIAKKLIFNAVANSFRYKAVYTIFGIISFLSAAYISRLITYLFFMRHKDGELKGAEKVCRLGYRLQWFRNAAFFITTLFVIIASYWANAGILGIYAGAIQNSILLPLYKMTHNLLEPNPDIAQYWTTIPTILGVTMGYLGTKRNFSLLQAWPVYSKELPEHDYINSVYDKIAHYVKSCSLIMLRKIDLGYIDQARNGLTHCALSLSRAISKSHSEQTQTYALWMVLGFIGVLICCL